MGLVGGMLAEPAEQVGIQAYGHELRIGGALTVGCRPYGTWFLFAVLTRDFRPGLPYSAAPRLGRGWSVYALRRQKISTAEVVICDLASLLCVGRRWRG
jgi:hypothetical protein